MLLSRVGIASIVLSVLALAACSTAPSFVVRDEPWRADEERACLASGLVQVSPPFVTARSSLGGPSACGAIQPFEVAATLRGTVAFQPPALVGCPMVHALDYWTERVVLPAGRRYLRGEVTGIAIMGSYSCRPMNGVDGALLSEHGHANAVDVAGFVLADGSTVRVRSGWRGTGPERTFLRAVHDGSCRVFTTVLGPDYNSLHQDHFHLDLARHAGDERVCK